MNEDTIAVFDFDHTITDRDSFLYFLFFTNGFWKTFFFFIPLVPFLLAYLCGMYTRKEIKEKILSHFFKGESLEKIKRAGQIYANQRLDQYLKPEAMKALAWHQAQGHRCILISASYHFYLDPWGIRHNFEKVFATEVEIDANMLTGRLDGENCWGSEKKRRLLDYLSSLSNIVLYVYGDSRGDKEILEIANYPFYRKFNHFHK